MIDRRQFCIGALATGLTPFARSADDAVLTVDGVVLPSWAIRTILGGRERFFQWKGMDETVSFPLITDTHSKTIGFAEGAVDWTDTKRHIYFLRAIAHAVGADFISDLGDHDMEISILGDPMPMSDVRRHLEAYKSMYAAETMPVLFSMGNHDHAKQRLSSAEYGEAFNRGVTQAHGHRIVLSEDGTWGYYDICGKKFRMVFANTSDEGYLGVSRAQLQFLADAFSSAGDGWTVMLQQHAQMPSFLGGWRRFMHGEAFKRDMVLMHMVDDFANRRGGLVMGFKKPAVYGEYDGVKWDFSSAKACFAGDLSGHSHTEAHVTIGGVTFMTRPGYGTVPRDCLAFGARDPKDTGENPENLHASPRVPRDGMLIDLVAVKPSERLVHVFRFGVGGAESDLEYSY